jgi:hypothetical protein
MESVIEMASCDVIYKPRLMKIDADVQTILRFWLRTLIGCNVGIAEEKELMNYTILMEIGVMLNMPNFINIGSRIKS